MWNLSRPFPQGVSSYSNSPLSGAWEERPLLPHTPASQERPAPAPIAPCMVESKELDRCSAPETKLFQQAHLVINAWRIPVELLSSANI